MKGANKRIPFMPVPSPTDAPSRTEELARMVQNQIVSRGIAAAQVHTAMRAVLGE